MRSSFGNCVHLLFFLLVVFLFLCLLLLLVLLAFFFLALFSCCDCYGYPSTTRTDLHGMSRNAVMQTPEEVMLGGLATMNLGPVAMDAINLHKAVPKALPEPCNVVPFRVCHGCLAGVPMVPITEPNKELRWRVQAEPPAREDYARNPSGHALRKQPRQDQGILSTSSRFSKRTRLCTSQTASSIHWYLHGSGRASPIPTLALQLGVYVLGPRIVGNSQITRSRSLLQKSRPQSRHY